MKAELFTIPNLAGGLNTKDSDLLIADNECVDIQNFEFDPVGSLKVRGGTAVYSGAITDPINSVISSKIFHIDKLYLAAGGSAFYAWAYFYGDPAYLKLFRDNGTGTFAAVTVNNLGTAPGQDRFLDTTAYFFSTKIDDRLIFTNGFNLPYWVSTTGNAKRLGIIAPTTLTVVDSGAGGAVADGWYRWRVTWENNTDSIESTPVTSIAYVAAGGNSTMTLTIPASADTNVDKMRIYRTHVSANEADANADTDFYFVAEADDATTYADTKIDADLTVAYDTDIDDHQPPPDKPRYPLEFQNRLWLIFDDGVIHRLYFSEIGKPDYFPTNNFIDIGTGVIGQPRGLFNLNDQLWCAFENGFRKVNSTGVTTTWSVDDPMNGPGVYSDRSLKVCEGMPVPIGTDDGKIIYGNRGIAMYLSHNGQTWAFDGDRFLNIGEKVDSFFTDAPEDTLLHAPAVYYPKRHQYKISLDSIPLQIIPGDIPPIPGVPTGFIPRTMVFDLLRKAWTKEDRIFECATVWNGTADVGELYAGDVANSYIRRHDIGAQDDGIDIEAYFRSKQYGIVSREVQKRFLKQYLDAFGAATTSVNMTVLLDRGVKTFNTEVTLGYGGTVTAWDNNIWDLLAAPTYSARIDGFLGTGAYKYAYRFYNSTTHEVTALSTLSATMAAMADPNDGIRITIPADDASWNGLKAGVLNRFDKYTVFRTKVGASVLFLEAASWLTRSTGAAFTHDSTIADASMIGIEIEYPVVLVWSDDINLDFAKSLNKKMVGKLMQVFIESTLNDSTFKINRWGIAYRQKTLH